MRLEYKICDCLDGMKELDDNTINCCVTSPPYFGLRDYGHPDQIGLEFTVEEYVKKLVEVFRQVKRVLRDDGTMWLNLGDSYSGSMSTNTSIKNKQSLSANMGQGKSYRTEPRGIVNGLKVKDLIGIPWRVAFALQADGWYLRQDIIWHKPNPMPESVKDRCTKAHEYIFLLSKSAKYYYDMDSIAEQATSTDNTHRDRDTSKLNNTPGRTHMNGLKTNHYTTKNKRSVWTIPTKPCKESHFATFPIDLIKPCILAGCPENGTVLDPFGGSGTTMECCRKTQRNCVLFELNKEYEPIIRKRAMLDTPDITTWGL